MSASFIDLGLPRDLAEHLAGNGITIPSPIQAATLTDLLAGRDVCAAAPTGSGKTLAFAAPLMARLGKGAPNRPAALVLTPTRELAAEIHTVLGDLGRVHKKWSSSVYGGVKQGPQVNNLRRGVDVLVACPGRLEDLIEQGHVKLDNVSIVVIDEADRMSDMGFLPCVRRIMDQCNAERQTMLFSATLDGAADALARTHLNNPTRHSVAPKVEDEGKATHLFWTAHPAKRPEMSAEIIRKAGRTILFTRTKHGADRLTEKLNAMGVQAAVIHGGRSQAQRDKSLADFHRGRVAALVATDVAARGIHVEKVACVVHVDLPDSPTDYQHRSGRTARAGESGVVVSLVTPEQRHHARNVQRAFGFPNGHVQPDMDHIQAGEVPVVVDRPARFEREDRPARTGGYDRPSRPGGYDRPRTDRDDRPRTGGYGRPAGSGGYKRDDRPSYGAPKRDDRPATTGGYKRDDRPATTGGYKRDDRPSYGAPKRDDRPATGGYRSDDRPSYGAPKRDDRPATAGGYRSDDRPRTERPATAGRWERIDRPGTSDRSERPAATGRYERPATTGRYDRPAPAGTARRGGPGGNAGGANRPVTRTTASRGTSSTRTVRGRA